MDDNEKSYLISIHEMVDGRSLHMMVKINEQEAQALRALRSQHPSAPTSELLPKARAIAAQQSDTPPSED